MAKSRDAFRTISEVADWLDTQAHVLRFWESKFTQVKPVKRAGGRRYYRPQDMQLLGGIKKLLHDDGMTIKGAQKLLREKGVKHVSGLSQPLDGEDGAEIAARPNQPERAPGKPVQISAIPADLPAAPDDQETLEALEGQAPEFSKPPSGDTATDPQDQDSDPILDDDGAQQDDSILLDTAPEASLTEDTEDEDLDELQDAALRELVDPEPKDTPTLFTNAQDSLEGEDFEDGEQDLPAPSQDTIPAFINRVDELTSDPQSVEEPEPDPVDDSSESVLVETEDSVDISEADVVKTPDAAAEDDPEETAEESEDLNAEEDSAQEEVQPALASAAAEVTDVDEFTRDQFLKLVATTTRIAPADRAQAAELVAKLDALRTRQSETDSA